MPEPGRYVIPEILPGNWTQVLTHLMGEAKQLDQRRLHARTMAAYHRQLEFKSEQHVRARKAFEEDSLSYAEDLECIELEMHKVTVRTAEERKFNPSRLPA